jgi:predicted MFS family arabinose efflux permease
MQENKSVAAAVALSCIGVFGILAAPILAQSLQAGLQFSPEQVGQIVAAEIFGGALASLVATLWIRSVNWRLAALVGIAVVIGANLLSSLQSTPGALTALRLLAGFAGQGTAFAVAIGIINDSSNHDRNFAFSIAAQVTVGILTLLILPPLAKTYGVGGVLVPLAVLAALALPLLAWVPAGSSRQAGPDAAGAGRASSMPAIAALAVLLIWCTGLGGIWTFLISIGEAGGLDPARAGQAIAISTGIAISGALFASWLAGRGGRLVPVSIALLVQTGAILLLQGDMGFVRFAVTAAVFQCFWNFTGPYLMGTVAANDPTGRISVLIPAAQTGGFALGPFIAGQLMTGGSLTAANYVGAVGCLLALAVFVPLVAALNRRQVQANGAASGH